MNEPATQTRPQPQNKLVQMFNFIVSWKTKNDGNSPTIRDIGEFMGIDSTSHISYLLRKLEELGMIELEDHSARAIKVVGGKWTYKAKGA